MFDELIYKLFSENWCGPQQADLELAKETLYKGLKQQQQGYWAGSTKYYIMVQGGFLIDGKSGTNKKLTALGEMFVEMMEKDNTFSYNIEQTGISIIYDLMLKCKYTINNRSLICNHHVI